MPVYYLKESKGDVPELLIDEENGFLSIEGSSYPEDINDVYINFFLELNKLNIIKGQDFLCKFKIKILSSASMRIFHEIFLFLEERHDAGATIEVNWIYEYEDEDMQEVGESFVELFDFKFNIIEEQA